MFDRDTGIPTTQVGQMICDREDFNNFCTSGVNAYTQPETGRFHDCARGMSKPLNSGILCDDLDASCSLKMRSLPMTVLHEMTHYNRIGEDARGGFRILDVEKGRGAHECFVLDTDQKGDNAQNYAWFAGEAYWSNYCGKTFEDPASGIQ